MPSPAGAKTITGNAGLSREGRMTGTSGGCPGRPAGSSMRCGQQQGWKKGKSTPCTGLGTGTASPGKVGVSRSGSAGAQGASEGSQERLPGATGTGTLRALRRSLLSGEGHVSSFPWKQAQNRQVLSEVKVDLSFPCVPLLFPSFKLDLEVCFPSPAVPGVGRDGQRQLLSSLNQD